MFIIPKIVEEPLKDSIIKMVIVFTICTVILYILYIYKYKDGCTKLLKIENSKKENLKKYFVNNYANNARYVDVNNLSREVILILYFNGSYKKYKVDKYNKTIDLGKSVLLKSIDIIDFNKQSIKIIVRDSSGKDLYLSNI